MKIAIASPGIYPYVLGGIQRHSFNLAKHLAQLCVQVDLYHTDFKQAEGIDELLEMSDLEKSRITSIAVPWIVTDRFPGHYVRSLKLFSQRIYDIYRQRSPADFIYAQSLTGWAFTQAKQAGEPLPPVMSNLHGYEMFQSSANAAAFFKNKLLQPSFRQQAIDSDYVVSLGGKLTLLIEELGVFSKRIVELNVGIDESWVTSEAIGSEAISSGVKSTNQPLRFVFVGRYERRKGIEELHSAIAAHPEWQSKAEFCFIGPIPDEKRLQLPHVSYAGKIMDEMLMQRSLRNADVLLCPSYSEGMPTVILEAMASGLAVIATDVGAVRLMVSAKNGVLLPEISVSLLSHAIESVLRCDPSLLLQMKQASLRRVRAFLWRNVAAQTLKTAESAIASAIDTPALLSSTP